MSIVWVIEKPGRLEMSLAAVLQGDVAVRAFASIKNFLKLGRMSSTEPQAIVIKGDDFPGDLENLTSIIDLHWPKSLIVVLGQVPPRDVARAYFLDRSSYPELPFVIQRLLRREKTESSPYVTMGDLCLDFEGNRMRILPEGAWVHLRLKEAQILRHLLRFQNKFLSHEDLCNEIWKGVKVSPKSVSSHMSRLRSSLDASHFTIESLYGGGYRLVNQDLET